MGKLSPLFGKYSLLLGKHPLLLCACLGIAALQPERAHARNNAATIVMPSHLNIQDQNFDASVAGLRQYLDTIRPANEQLYAQLVPDLQRLEDKSAGSTAAFLAGTGLGLISGVVAVVAWKDCPGPSVDDPNFAARINDWDACNRDNSRTMLTFSLIGVAAIAAGGIAALAIAPRRADLLDFINKHNRLSAQPLRLQIGYQPDSRLAYGGATLAF